MFTLRRKIILFFILVVFFISLLFGISSTVYFSSILEREAESLVFSQTEILANQILIQNKMTEVAVNSIGFLAADDFDYDLALKNKVYIQKKVDSLSSIERKLLLDLQQSESKAISIYVNYDVDAFEGNYGNWFIFENNTIISHGNEPLDVFYPENPEMVWYYTPKKTGVPQWTGVYTDSQTRVKMISYVVPFYTKEGKFLGVAGADISLENVERLVSSSKVLNEGYSFLIDSKGYIVVEPKTNISLSSIEKLRLENKLLGKGVISFNGGLLGYYSLPNGKIVMTYVSGEDLLHYINMFRFSLAIMVIVISFIFLIISFFISRSFIYQIISLRDAVEKMRRGELKVHAKVYTHDELGELAVIFNKMSAELGLLKEALEEKVDERTKALTDAKKDLERRTLLADKAKIATLNILEDVEESKQRLDEAYKQLRALEKLKNNFLSFTTHELKTPLTPILIQAQMLQEGDLGKLSSEQKKSLDMIVRNMKNLNQLIGDVMDISVIQSANLKIFPLRADISEIIKQTVLNAESLAKQKNLQLNMKVPRLHHVLIDSRRIGQVVTNLLSNAIKFTPEGGSISVEAYETPEDIVVKVTDTGIGIAKDKIDTLFQPFSQVSASYTLKQKGTGLGLAICKGIISAHKGKIWVQSEIGKGSTFYFSIPRNWHFGGNKK